jgi:hypothetical protein
MALKLNHVFSLLFFSDINCIEDVYLAKDELIDLMTKLTTFGV